MKTPKIEKDEKFFYKNIRTLRSMKRYTQNYVADIIGVSQVYYSKMELGEKSISLSGAIKITKLYDLSLDKLIYNDLQAETDVAFRRLR